MSQCTCYVLKGTHQGGATLFAALWCCLWGRDQRGNNAAHLLRSSLTFQNTLLLDWEFPQLLKPPQYFTGSFQPLVFHSASPDTPVVRHLATSILSAQLPISASPPLLLVWVNVSFFSLINVVDFIYLFLYRGEGREKEGEKHQLARLHQGTWPTTQAYALTGNRTRTLWFTGRCSIH